MAITVGQLVATIKLDMGTSARDLNTLRDSMGRLKTQTDGLGNGSTGALDRLAKSATNNRQAWNTVGTAMTAFGAATAAVGIAALKTGVDYNSLRQTATAALTSVTGSTEGAALQMKKLDDFGRGSWLMRDSLIRAQKQMTGFGVETGKVVPYMEGLAEAVAASGGNNQTFEELAFIMAKIEGQSKITAQELNEFGQRGVDAASIIGTSMGKTGGQIRADITAGTLDATVALDALAAGMTETYEGSSDLIRDTFDGAIANVKGAWRDLGATLAEPLVSAEGGGILVDLANNTADVIGAFEKMDPVARNTALALGGLISAGSLTVGAFMLLAPRALEANDAFNTLTGRTGTLSGRLGKVGRVAGTAAVSFVAVGAAISAIEMTAPKLSKGIEELEANLKALADGGADIGPMFDDINRGWHEFGGVDIDFGNVDEFRASLQAVADPNWINSVQDGIMGFFGAENVGQIGQFRGRLDEIGGSLADLSGSNLPKAVDQFQALYEAAGNTEEGGRQLLKAMPDLKDSLIGVADGAGLATDESTLLSILLGEVVPRAEGAEGALEGVTGAQGNLEGATEDTRSALQEYIDSVKDGTSSAEGYADALQEVIDKQRESSDVALNARDAERNFESAIDGATEAINGYRDGLIEKYTEQGNSTEAAKALADADIKSGEALDITTEAGRKNQEKLDDIATSGWGTIESMNALDASERDLQGSMSDTRDAFVKAADKMGMTKEEANKLADSLGLIPSEVSTTANLTDNASNKIDNLKRKLLDFNGKTFTATAQINQKGDVYGYRNSNAPGGITLRNEGGIVGFANGGQVPGTPPSNPYVDNILASTQNGSLYGIRSGEWIINEPASKKNDAWLRAMNGGLDLNKALGAAPGLVGGGRVTPLAPTPAVNRGPVSEAASAIARTAPNQPVEIHIHSVPTDNVEETAKALNFALRSRGGVYGIGAR